MVSLVLTGLGLTPHNSPFLSKWHLQSTTAPVVEIHLFSSYSIRILCPNLSWPHSRAPQFILFKSPWILCIKLKRKAFSSPFQGNYKPNGNHHSSWHSLRHTQTFMCEWHLPWSVCCEWAHCGQQAQHSTKADTDICQRHSEGPLTILVGFLGFQKARRRRY